jgi:cysteine desulfurase
VAHLTGNFTSEAPLSKAVTEAISAAFSQGWAEPKKLSQSSHRALDLKTAALEEIANHLAVSPAALEVLGEPSLAHFIAIGGFLTPEKRFFFSGVDVGKIRAVARAHPGESQILDVTAQGQIETPASPTNNDVISIQATNGETGVTQDLDRWRALDGSTILDATRTIPAAGITNGFAAATFDATSWNGPAGLSLIAINDSEKFRYPLPHIAPIRVPGSFSLPLLIGSAVALTEIKAEEKKIYDLRKYGAAQLSAIDGVTLVGADIDYQSRYVTILIGDLSGEEVLRSLMKLDINCDSGSACSPEDLAPSHVLAAMGHPTTGSLRFTFNATHTNEDIDLLIASLKDVLTQLRS